MYETIPGLPGTAEAQSFFQVGCSQNHLTLKLHQQAQARLSTGGRGSGLPWTEEGRMSTSIARRVGTLSEVKADLTGP